MSGLPSGNDGGFMPGGVDTMRQQIMLASLAGGGGGEDSSSPVAAATTAGPSVLPVPSQSSASPGALGGNPSSDQVEALMYDQALLRASMQGVGGAGSTTAARIMALQNQPMQAALAAQGMGGEPKLSNDHQNQQIMSLLSDRSLTVQEEILKKLKDQSSKSK